MQFQRKHKQFLGLYITTALFSALMLGCASYKTVSTENLEGRQLVGHWESQDAYINIYCNSSFSAKIPGDELTNGGGSGGNSTSGAGTPSNVTSGKHIEKLTDKTFVVATFLSGSKETYHVQRWPYQSPQGWQMKIEGQDWKRTSYDSCR